jgi:ubiquinone biosynthesis protein UbiJ
MRDYLIGKGNIVTSAIDKLREATKATLEASAELELTGDTAASARLKEIAGALSTVEKRLSGKPGAGDRPG